MRVLANPEQVSSLTHMASTIRHTASVQPELCLAREMLLSTPWVRQRQMVPQNLPAARNAAETDLTHLHVTAATFDFIFLTGLLGTG